MGGSLEATAEERTVAEVSEQDFDAQVLESAMPVAVAFYAHWCGPCQRQSPILDQAVRELDNARIVKLNVGENRELTAAYQVRSIPTLLVFEDGQVVDRHVGLASKEQVKSLLKRGTAE
ncbi:MAG: thioredoxin [Planctomycetaceae bacterium]|nr:MAG: thioredoxin [Planctomycetaceae bacterium]